MDFEFTADEHAFRKEVQAFLDAELPSDKAFNHEFNEDADLWAFAFEFTKKVGAKGWIGLTWPVEYGGLGRSQAERLILAEEFTARDAPLVNMIGWGLAAGALLVGGTDEQKKRFLPGIAAFDRFWAEGLTEPDSGSDLASLTTRAERDGDDWIVTGQKTYTTWGHHADVMFLAARTDPNAPPHRGISVFCLDLKAPGVSLTPLYNIGGGRQNHTFFDGVRVPGPMLIGEEGQGWSYIMNAFYAGGGLGARHAEMRLMLNEVVEYCKATTRGGVALIKDPIVRSQLAELELMIETERLLTYESLSNATNGRPPRFGGALGVVVSKEHKPLFGQIITQIVGPLAQLRQGSRWAPIDGGPEAWYRWSYANHAGGTSQVKRMVLATRGLGLPR
ncbi:MAG TPA: acyl-CoA dehydrogenase family protein [Acidimicrobiales bacterium]